MGIFNADVIINIPPAFFSLQKSGLVRVYLTSVFLLLSVPRCFGDQKPQFDCAVVLDSWNRKRWTQPTCSLGLSYESRVNRLGGVASSVSLGRLNRPSSLLHVPSSDLPCLVKVCSSPHPSATCNVARVTRPACPRDMPLGA